MLTTQHPEHVTAWNNLAALLADDPAHLSGALECIDRGLAAAGRPIATLLDTKAVILLRMQKLQRAAEILRQVLAMPDGNDPRFFLHYAITQRRIGDMVGARQMWRRAQELGVGAVYLTDFEQAQIQDLEVALVPTPSTDQLEESHP